MRFRSLVVLLVLAFGLGIALGARISTSTQGMELSGETYQSPGGTTIRLLLDEHNLGGSEVDVGEITFPAGSNSGSHPHGATEIFYVLSGELDHVVNGKSHLLKPGMLGFVRPPDQVNHVVPGNEPVKALVIWAPGGEAHRIVDRWKKVE
jgi:quercetin dioxygenase-like cupin family protein